MSLLCTIAFPIEYGRCNQQACLAWWSTVSPFGGTGSTAALAFVLVVAGVKAVWEDVKRHQEDVKTNKSTAHLVNSDGKTPLKGRLLSCTVCLASVCLHSNWIFPLTYLLIIFVGSTVDIRWKDVRVGQVLQVRDDELFPADLLCLHSALPDR